MYNLCVGCSVLNLYSANKSEVKHVEDWRCPSGSTSPAGSRRRDGNTELKARAIIPATGLQRQGLQRQAITVNDASSAASTARPRAVLASASNDAVYSNDEGLNVVDTVPQSSLPQIHIALLIFTGLLLVMIAVGVLSYYRALYS